MPTVRYSKTPLLIVNRTTLSRCVFVHVVFVQLDSGQTIIWPLNAPWVNSYHKRFMTLTVVDLQAWDVLHLYLLFLKKSSSNELQRSQTLFLVCCVASGGFSTSTPWCRPWALATTRCRTAWKMPRNAMAVFFGEKNGVLQPFKNMEEQRLSPLRTGNMSNWNEWHFS